MLGVPAADVPGGRRRDLARGRGPARSGGSCVLGRDVPSRPCLRSIGARAGDIRRIFATETIALATAGWLIAIPLGYLLDRLVVWLVKTVVNEDVPVTFRPVNLPIALAGTILLALLITPVPVRHAVHYKPGEALRYT